MSPEAGELILELQNQLDQFLHNWTVGMKEAGYLEHTTAKRSDCLQAFWGVLNPLFNWLSDKQVPSFAEMITSDRSFADFAVQEARRHRFRGITFEMYLGCFKTFTHSLEQIIAGSPGSQQSKRQAAEMLRSYLDAVESIFVGDWAAITQKETLDSLGEANRRLTLEKNKYENILCGTRDLVFIINHQGIIQEANETVQDYYEAEEVLGEPFWRVLELEGRDLEEVLRYYPPGQAHEISVFDEGIFFVLKISPLNEVSLAQDGYMLVLNNISCVVNQREQLEKRLSERTRALEESSKRFRSLFRAAGDGILLVDTSLQIAEANERAGDIFGYHREQLIGLGCHQISEPGVEDTLSRVIKSMDDDQIWMGELTGRRNDQGTFPMEMTINRVDLSNRTVFHVVVRDITERQALLRNLEQEKRQLAEMNVTLKHVMKSIDQEKIEMERNISSKIETLVLPALDKVEKERSAGLRTSYLEILKQQLLGLTKGFSKELDGRLLTLTPTEMRICQMILSGGSSKQIANTLNLAYDTVQTHRKSIRRKLGLQGRGVNLHTYLSSKTDRSKIAGI